MDHAAAGDTRILAVTLLIVVFAAAVSVLLLHIDHRLHRRG